MELITTMWLAPDGGTNPKGLEDASGCSPKNGSIKLGDSHGL